MRPDGRVLRGSVPRRHGTSLTAGGPIKKAGGPIGLDDRWDHLDVIGEGGVEGRLLFVEGSPVDIPGLSEGLSAEAEDGGLVDEALADGDRLGRGGQDFLPLRKGQVGDDHGGALTVPGADHPEELVGAVAVDGGEARVFEDQEIRLLDPAEELPVRSVGP